MSRSACFGRRDDASHLLVCPDCRADARVAAAWRKFRVSEPTIEPGEGFVADTVAGIGRRRAALRRRRWIAAAAAAALFSFCAGLAHEHAASQAAASPEDAYAAFVAPSALEGLVPN